MVETLKKETNICQESEEVTSNIDTFLTTFSLKLMKIDQYRYITKKYKEHFTLKKNLEDASRNFLRIFTTTQVTSPTKFIK